MRHKTKLIALFVATVTFAQYGLADEEVLLESDEQAQEILLNKTWKCEWKDAYYSGTSDIVYQQVSLKKVTAKVKNSVCPSGWGQYEGKIKKGRTSGRSSKFPAPCNGGITGQGRLYLSADGQYYTKGTYRPTAYQASGTSRCVVQAE